MSSPPDRRHCSAGGRALSFLRAGDPDPSRLVVFLHAFPLTAGMWRPQLAVLAPGAVLDTIPGAGHLPNLEAPESFNRAMLAWMRAVERSAA